jgi:hypothetical protein
MNNFLDEVTPKLSNEILGLIVLGPNQLNVDQLQYFNLNFFLDGLLSQKGKELSHTDTFLTKQFNQTVFLLYFDEEKTDDLHLSLKNILSMLKNEFKVRQKILVTSINRNEVVGVEKLKSAFHSHGLELVI